MTDFIQRNLGILTNLGNESELHYVEVDDVKDLHEQMKRYFNMPAALNRPELLESAVGRPHHLVSYGGETDVVKLAASLSYGLAKNHAFTDGNKRISLLAMDLFLYRNGIDISLDNEAVENIFKEMASGELDEEGFKEAMSEYAQEALDSKYRSGVEPDRQF